MMKQITQKGFTEFVENLIAVYMSSKTPKEAAEKVIKTYGKTTGEYFNIICHIKEYDGRISPRVRKHFYSYAVNGAKVLPPSEYRSYASCAYDIDKIHPAHLEQIMAFVISMS